MSYSIKFLCDNHITDTRKNHPHHLASTSFSAKGGAR